MAQASSNAESSASEPETRQYVVVARRYRPQTFDDLVGQQHVAKALSNAISGNRVGHAYLFTGARGVGKTSAARILAKALNCEQGPAPVPCNHCDLCRSISSGDDVDVLEIDGASNRGIDEIRQLRQNVNVRPSRSRFKIYIIDEVHMLTREAFNALLKTLEEPPEHVKFIFCTTEPTKIPITILSRCQRFDFAGIQATSIAERLRQIVAAEGLEAEPEALDTLARRAAGSMRDSQSLLEQLLAFSPGRITVADVHTMLGTAADEFLDGLVTHLVQHEPAAALADLEAALSQGVDVGQLLEQLLGYFRDCMVAAAGGPPETLFYVSPAGRAAVIESGKRLGLATVLAAMQIIDQALSRLRVSTQGRLLAELALVQITQLEDLDELSTLVARLESGAGAELPAPARRSAAATAAPAAAPAPGKKNAPVAAHNPAEGQPSEAYGGGDDGGEPAPRATPPQAGPALALTAASAVEVWSTALGALSGMVVDCARQFERVTLAGPNHLVVTFKAGYAMPKSICEKQATRIEQALAQVTGQRVRVQFAVDDEAAPSAAPPPAASSAVRHQRMLQVMQHPLVRRANELFGAQPIKIVEPGDQEHG